MCKIVQNLQNYEYLLLIKKIEKKMNLNPNKYISNIYIIITIKNAKKHQRW